MGKLITSQKITSQKTTIAVSNLPPGMYFLKLEVENAPKVFKIIKEYHTIF
jgi:hypothetical protein